MAIPTAMEIAAPPPKETASAAAPVTALMDELSVALSEMPRAWIPKAPSPSMAAVTFMDIPLTDRAPAPAPARPTPAPPAMAAAKAPTNASMDCSAVAVRVRLPFVELTLEFRILDWTSPGLFLEMRAGLSIPSDSFCSDPMRFRATAAPIASPAPTSLPTAIATDAPMTTAEIWGSNTEKSPDAFLAMITEIPECRSVTDHSLPVSSSASVGSEPVSSLRIVTARSSASVDKVIPAAANLAWRSSLNALSAATSVGSGVPFALVTGVPRSYSSISVSAASSRLVVKASEVPTDAKSSESAAERDSEVMETFPVATSTLFCTNALVLVLMRLVDSAPAPLTAKPASLESAAATAAATETA